MSRSRSSSDGPSPSPRKTVSAEAAHGERKTDPTRAKTPADRARARRARGQLPLWYRRFPPTREGWYFLTATLLIGLAALNAGLNPLFLIWGAMLSLIVMSGVLSELCIRRIEVRRHPPAVVHAGTPYLMGIAFHNQKRRLPSFSVEVEDLLEGRPIEKRCYFLKVPAGRAQETAYRTTARRRGRYHLTGFRVSTRFPFGLIQKSRDIPSPCDVLVYPALVPVPPALLKGLPTPHGRGTAHWHSRRGDFFGLREFRQGDDPRDIHWRTSARRGAPFVREMEDDEGHETTVVLDNAAVAEGAGASDEAFENAVSLAASVARTLLGRGHRVGLVTRDAELRPDAGPGQLTRVMRLLATIGRVGSTEERSVRPQIDAGTMHARIRITPGRPPVVEQPFDLVRRPA